MCCFLVLFFLFLFSIILSSFFQFLKIKKYYIFSAKNVKKCIFQKKIRKLSFFHTTRGRIKTRKKLKYFLKFLSKDVIPSFLTVYRSLFFINEKKIHTNVCSAKNIAQKRKNWVERKEWTRKYVAHFFVIFWLFFLFFLLFLQCYFPFWVVFIIPFFFIFNL